MNAARLPAPGVDLTVAPIPLPPAAAHHAVDVLRLGEGAAVILFDGAGSERAGTLVPLDGGWAVAPTGPVLAGRGAAPLTLVYGLPKGDKLDRVVRMATELGVARVVLVQMARCVTRLDGGKADKRLDRLERVATEAARQSLRADVPELVGPLTVAQAVALRDTHGAGWCLHPDDGVPWQAALAGEPLAVWVGPEGGFAPEELAAARAGGWQTVSLATPVLRTETAAPIAVALGLARLGWA
ncbi:MAG: 16S rRNA (uracil(1498)-N(3))-methyltransferase [Myxococcales bacterium]|nr:16S rRNA (uracil(1498)-N(3))-methyltransferase [Myxococcales bacterium]